MYTQTCGDRGQHWYGKDKMCACGQVPNRLLAAVTCNCGSRKREPREHEQDCRLVKWALERNVWVAAHPEVEPPLPPVPERTVRGQSAE